MWKCQQVIQPQSKDEASRKGPVDGISSIPSFSRERFVPGPQEDVHSPVCPCSFRLVEPFRVRTIGGDNGREPLSDRRFGLEKIGNGMEEEEECRMVRDR